MKKQRQISMRKRDIIILVLLVVILIAYHFWSNVGLISLNEMAQLINEGDVTQITVRGERIELRLWDNSRRFAVRDPALSLIEMFDYLGVSNEAREQVTMQIASQQTRYFVRDLIIMGVPLVLIAAMLLNFILNTQESNRKEGNDRKHLSKHVARRIDRANRPSVTFADVAGAAQAKEELQEVVSFLRHPERFQRLGARIPRGVLMVGPPGTGKTLMARAVAGEAGVPFYSTSGSEFVEMYAGVGASRVRDLFAQAAQNAPSIIFIDEIDSVGRQRGMSTGNSSDERDQTLNQILTEMDGFNQNAEVIIIAATNRLDILDPALLRPGRFDRHVFISLPQVNARQKILQHYLQNKPLAPDIVIEVIARQTAGFSGADLANLLNEAAILAARRAEKVIMQEHIQESIERISVGPRRQGRVLNPEDKEIVAYHEAGHALTMMYQPECTSVHKVSILERGQSLGYTMPLPDEARVLRSKKQYIAELVALLGGRAAEQLVYNTVTTSAKSDLERATRLAYGMVTRYGMSQSLGALSLTGRSGQNYSEQLRQRVDAEVQHLLTEAEQQAKVILKTHWRQLQCVAAALLEQETLSYEELQTLLEEEEVFVEELALVEVGV